MRLQRTRQRIADHSDSTVPKCLLPCDHRARVGIRARSKLMENRGMSVMERPLVVANGRSPWRSMLALDETSAQRVTTILPNWPLFSR